MPEWINIIIRYFQSHDTLEIMRMVLDYPTT